MNHRLQTISCFSASCLLTGIAWWMAWPKQETPSHPASVPISAPREPAPWTRARLEEIVSALRSATTDAERFAAASRAAEIPASKFPEALGLAELIQDRKLTFTAKALLIRWSEKNGDAALMWSWQRFRLDFAWDQAFREIMPGWAARAPMDVADWVIDHYDSKSSDPVLLKDALEKDGPILDSRNLDSVSKWLIREDPRAAFRVRRARAGWSSNDANLANSLHTADEIRHAMLAFEDLDPVALSDSSFSNDELAAVPLLFRWETIDPWDFAKSPYAKMAHHANDDPALHPATGWQSISGQERPTIANNALAKSPPEHVATDIQRIATQWSKADPAGTFEWLDSLPAEHQDAKLAAYAHIMAPQDLDGVMKRTGGLSTMERSTLIVRAFESWHKAHPGGKADTSRWDQGALEIWQDMELLRQAPGE